MQPIKSHLCNYSRERSINLITCLVFQVQFFVGSFWERIASFFFTVCGYHYMNLADPWKPSSGLEYLHKNTAYCGLRNECEIMKNSAGISICRGISLVIPLYPPPPHSWVVRPLGRGPHIILSYLSRGNGCSFTGSHHLPFCPIYWVLQYCPFLAQLKVPLHEIFDLWFFPSKGTLSRTVP